MFGRCQIGIIWREDYSSLPPQPLNFTLQPAGRWRRCMECRKTAKL